MLALPACQLHSRHHLYHGYHEFRTCDAEFKMEEAERQAKLAADELERQEKLEAKHKALSLEESQELAEKSYCAIDSLLAQHRESADIERLLVATVVDVNNVNGTSMLGRVLSELISTRVTQSDIDVIHPTVRDDHLLIQSSGQFLLSRDVKNLDVDYNAKSALVSTYAVAGDTVRVSMKLVSTISNSTLAATDFVLYQNTVVNDMLGTRVAR
ncbi:MAG: hypothetical protein H8E25_15320 [Planctomycetes bacterium]|nr:hypothetical protein [Planctomycetota bacterium]